MEQPGQEVSTPRRRRSTKGRQDRSGQEAVIKMAALDERMPHLVKLHGNAKDASKDFSQAVKAVAEKSGLLASVVRRFVTAKAGEHFEDKQKEAYQLSLVFGESKAA
jgi:hypothetical protein